MFALQIELYYGDTHIDLGGNYTRSSRHIYMKATHFLFQANEPETEQKMHLLINQSTTSSELCIIP